MLSVTMTPLPWAERARQVMSAIGNRPFVLLLVLLLANALARPYANISHDTRLYSVQVLNKVENGTYNDDLFFRYGSQDQYSCFSTLMAPLVQALGLELAFFLGYLIGNFILIAGLARLVLHLVENPVVALLTLLYLVMAPLNYGGLYILHVHEPFLTPRLLSVALIIWGLGQLLDGRYFISLAFMLLGVLLHPLMAVGGCLVWTGVFCVNKFGWQRTSWLVGLGCLAGAVLLAIPSLASRLFGTMDDTWREYILQGSSFNFTSEWELRDWVNVLMCWLALVGGIYLYREKDPRRAWFFAVTALVGLAAVVGTILATHLPYALLLQGQPYRALWILKVLQVPLFAVLAEKFWVAQKVGQQALALVLIGFLVTTTLLPLEWLMPLFFLPIVLIYFRGLDAQPRHTDWLMRGVAVSVVLGSVSWALYKEWILIQGRDMILAHFDVFEMIHLLIDNFGVLPWIVVMLIVILATYKLAGGERGLAAVALLGFVVINLFFYLLPSSQFVRANHTRYLPDIVFASDYLKNHPRPDGKVPHVYSGFGRVDYVWLEMKANSYFDWWQAGGFMFQRATAIEGKRRALVVSPFEVGRFRDIEPFLRAYIKRDVPRFFLRDLASPAPTLEDLAQLCREENLDFAVLKQEFPGLYAATNGTVYIYDCRQLQTVFNTANDSVVSLAKVRNQDLQERNR